MKKLIIALILGFMLSPVRIMAGTVVNDSIPVDSIKRELSLDELVVKADRIRQKPGGYVVSLMGTDMAKGKDMNSLLAALLGLTLEEGLIKVNGQAPAAVYLDGVLTSMDIVKALPAERIASV